MLTHLGFAQLQLGQYDDAATTFARAKEASGGRRHVRPVPGAGVRLGTPVHEALSVLGPLRAKNPADVRVVQLEARALAGGGRRDEAITRFAR